jgi:NAD-dependent deacetylase
VVWFGEALPADTLTRAALESRQASLFISAGTSSLVYPAASLPFEALTGGAALLEVNPDPTPLSTRARWSLRGPSGEILPALLACAFERAEC